MQNTVQKPQSCPDCNKKAVYYCTYGHYCLSCKTHFFDKETEQLDDKCEELLTFDLEGLDIEEENDPENFEEIQEKRKYLTKLYNDYRAELSARMKRNIADARDAHRKYKTVNNNSSHIDQKADRQTLMKSQSDDPISVTMQRLTEIGKMYGPEAYMSEIAVIKRDKPELAKKLADTMFTIGLDFQDSRNIDQAISYYNIALSFNNFDDEIYTALGIAYQQKGYASKDSRFLESAKTAFENAIDCNPKSAVAHCMYGSFLSTLFAAYDNKNYGYKALEEFRKAIEIDPHYSDALQEYEELRRVLR